MPQRDYITVYTTPDATGPSLDLMHGKRQRIVVFAQLAQPQPENLPPGMVAIELPSNCYIDPSAAGELDDPNDYTQWQREQVELPPEKRTPWQPKNQRRS